MSPLDFTYASKDGQAVVTVYAPGHDPKVLNSDHPHFDQVWQALQDPDRELSDADIIDLCDVEKGYAKRFERLSDRVTFANRQVYFDGDPTHSALTREIVRVLDESGSPRALVAFLEKLNTNPNEHSRTELYEWVAEQGLTIVDSEDETCGDVIGYKGCTRNGDGILYSKNATGRAIVNGEVHEGQIPYPIGAIVEMPRSEVLSAPGIDCAEGLHIGTYTYARSYATSGALLEVRINPRDVVSVPGHADKMRVCRLRVIKEIDREYETATVRGDAPPKPAPVGRDKAHIPTSEEWKEMKARAKRRRQNFRRYAEARGWKFSSSQKADPDDPKCWRVPAIKVEGDKRTGGRK